MKMLRDKAELERLYNDEKRTLREIGDMLGVSGTSVRRAMVKHGIPFRTPGPKSGGARKKDYPELESVVARIKTEIARFPKPMRKRIIQGFIFSECRVYPDIKSALRAVPG